MINENFCVASSVKTTTFYYVGTYDIKYGEDLNGKPAFSVNKERALKTTRQEAEQIAKNLGGDNWEVKRV